MRGRERSVPSSPFSIRLNAAERARVLLRFRPTIVAAYERYRWAVIDEERLHRERLARARASLKAHGQAVALLADPMNVRYVSVPGQMVVCNLHTSYRYVLVPVESDPILWEYQHGLWQVPDYWTGEVRPSLEFTFFGSGSNTRVDAEAFACAVAEALRERGLLGERLGVDRMETVAHLALAERGIAIADAQPALETARAVKTMDELDILRDNARLCDAALDAMRKALQPGISENELWGTYLGAAAKAGAEWCETRLLASGPRTNPWFQEATARVVQAGELLGIDTDLVGPMGYLTDISRTYLCGSGRPTEQQRRLYGVAYEFVHQNMQELRPGVSFAELGTKLAKRLPAEFRALRYPMIAHGSGMVDEYPSIKWDDHHDGEIEVGMVFSVEAYAGEVGGSEGVKFEEQIIVTADGPENLSRAPHDERLLG